MAVIVCRECHQPVSTEAPACPHCGCPTDPKPTHKAAKSSLGNDPRCYVCGRPANRACSQCGQFCCGNHIGEPSNHSPALCNACHRARYRGTTAAFVFILLLVISFSLWKVYKAYNPPKPIDIDVEEIWRKHMPPIGKPGPP